MRASNHQQLLLAKASSQRTCRQAQIEHPKSSTTTLANDFVLSRVMHVILATKEPYLGFAKYWFFQMLILNWKYMS